MNKQLINILKQNHGVHLAMIDAYCQKICKDISCTILTNIDTANNHFIMKKIDIIGRTHKGQSGIVYGVNGISPTITTNKGDGQYIQTLEQRKDECVNSITTVQKDNLIIEPDNTQAALRGRKPVVLGWTRDKKGNVINRHPVSIANTITSAKRDNTQNYVVIPANTKTGKIKCEIGGVIDISYPTSKTRRGRVQDGGNTTPALTCGCENNIAQITTDFRIRKLTERECFRLMGVLDADSDKIRQVVSKTQCYKLAGNSIVVDVLVEIFNQLFSKNKTTDKQLKLF